MRGTAERICAKFTGKDVFGPSSVARTSLNVKVKGLKVTRDKNALHTPITPGSD